MYSSTGGRDDFKKGEEVEANLVLNISKDPETQELPQYWAKGKVEAVEKFFKSK